MVKDTDNGRRIMEEIDDLYELLEYYKRSNIGSHDAESRRTL